MYIIIHFFFHLFFSRSDGMQGKLYVVMWSNSQVIILHDFILDNIPLLVSSHPTTSLIKKMTDM